MNITIERITIDNYSMYDDMVAWRINGHERTKEEKKENCNRSFDHISNELNHKDFYVYAALCDTKYVGWISLIYVPKIGKWNAGMIYVDELWTASCYRRLGIAKKLMNKAFEMQKELNACKVRLYTGLDNIPAQSLYKKCGLEPMEEALGMEN